MQSKKILIVDDSKVLLKTLSNALSAEGYEVLTAEDGSAAVNLARQHRPDLMLLDISFPPDIDFDGGVAWDGFLIMDWLRRLGAAKTTPVIVITGGDPAKYRARALAAGAVGYLQKPINPDELLAAVREVLEA